jgi:hypothetical protein
VREDWRGRGQTTKRPLQYPRHRFDQATDWTIASLTEEDRQHNHHDGETQAKERGKGSVDAIPLIRVTSWLAIIAHEQLPKVNQNALSARESPSVYVLQANKARHEIVNQGNNNQNTWEVLSLNLIDHIFYRK